MPIIYVDQDLSSVDVQISGLELTVSAPNSIHVNAGSVVFRGLTHQINAVDVAPVLPASDAEDRQYAVSVVMSELGTTVVLREAGRVDKLPPAGGMEIVQLAWGSLSAGITSIEDAQVNVLRPV